MCTNVHLISLDLLVSSIWCPNAMFCFFGALHRGGNLFETLLSVVFSLRNNFTKHEHGSSKLDITTNIETFLKRWEHELNGPESN